MVMGKYFCTYNACFVLKWCLGKFFIRSKRYRERKKQRKMEKILGKKREDTKLRKWKSRRKLAKYEIKKSKKIVKEQVALSHKLEHKEIRIIRESLSHLATFKARGKVQLFRKNVHKLLDEFSICDISKATGIPYYKVDRMLMWKRKTAILKMYTWKLPQSVKEEVADFYCSSLISYELPDMCYCKK